MTLRQVGIALTKALGRFGAAFIAMILGYQVVAVTLSVMGVMVLLGNVERLVAVTVLDFAAKVFGYEHLIAKESMGDGE